MKPATTSNVPPDLEQPRAAEYNANSIDATLARILANQAQVKEDLALHELRLAAQLKEHHTEIIERIIGHEKEDLRRHDEIAKDVAALKKWKYTVVGGATVIIFTLEHGFSWLFGKH